MFWTNKITPGRGGPAAQRPHGEGVCAKEADPRMTSSGTARRDGEGLWDAAGWLRAARTRSSKPRMASASLLTSTPIFFLSPARQSHPHHRARRPSLHRIPDLPTMSTFRTWRRPAARPDGIAPPGLDPGEVCPPAADPAGPTPAPATGGLDPREASPAATTTRARRSPARARRPRSEGGRSAPRLQPLTRSGGGGSSPGSGRASAPRAGR
ncbi:unnamed protein product [Urochloa humidicola]